MQYGAAASAAKARDAAALKLPPLAKSPQKAQRSPAAAAAAAPADAAAAAAALRGDAWLFREEDPVFFTFANDPEADAEVVRRPTLPPPTALAPARARLLEQRVEAARELEYRGIAGGIARGLARAQRRGAGGGALGGFVDGRSSPPQRFARLLEVWVKEPSLDERIREHAERLRAGERERRRRRRAERRRHALEQQQQQQLQAAAEGSWGYDSGGGFFASEGESPGSGAEYGFSPSPSLVKLLRAELAVGSPAGGGGAAARSGSNSPTERRLYRLQAQQQLQQKRQELAQEQQIGPQLSVGGGGAASDHSPWSTENEGGGGGGERHRHHHRRHRDREGGEEEW